MPFVFSDRDFVIEKKVWNNYNNMNNHSLIYIHSIDHPDYPEKDKPVRGMIYCRIFYIREEGNGKCRVNMINQVNMKMPNIAQFIAIKKATEFTNKFIKFLKDELNKNYNIKN